MKKYILIAGVNGAGKSTLYQILDSLKDIKRINTDEIVRSFGNWRNAEDIIKASRIAVKEIKYAFDAGISLNQETTLCGSSIMKNIEKAKALGYEIVLHYVGVESVEIAKKRIAYRVAHGGHGIPDVDVERRYTESFENLKRVIPICDLVVLYDNTEAFNRFAVYKNGKIVTLSEDRPEWYIKL
ncbi:MAG: zeta toxin family protein [Lachnospiraceae bacterium]|nr:zeta toxin family protein [Lachnospiraceae bacterium]